MSCSMCDPSGSHNLIGMARPRTPILFFFVVILAILISLSGPAVAEWSAITGSHMTYTDDVFQFSASRRQKFSEDPSQPTVVPAEKKSDIVWDPSLEVIRSSTSSLGLTEVSAKAHGFLYTSNPVFNHGDYRLQVKQGLSSDTAVLVRYRYVPNLFLGPNFERRTGTRLIEDERVTSHTGRVEVEQKLGSKWVVNLIGRGGLRLYNEAFAERDTTFWTVGPHVSYAFSDRVTASLGYLFERGYADGAGDTRFNDDVSYRQHIMSAGLDAGLTEQLSLHLLYLYRRKDFTSELIGDTHLNRHDDTHQGAAELRYRVSQAAMLTLGVQRTQRNSTNETRSFQDTQVSIGGQYRF